MSEYSPYDLLRRRREPLDKKFNPSGIGPGMSYGKLLSILADFVPGIGDAKSGVDAIDAAQQGDFLGAGLAGLGVLPFVGSLKSLPIGHPDLSQHPLDELQSVLDEMRSANKNKKLDTETGTGAIRDEIARRNAHSMLGLPEGNTAMDRAKALGYTQQAYHGTPYGGDIYNFGSEHRGRSTSAKSAKTADWASDSPVVAASYADQPTTSNVSNSVDDIDKWNEFKNNYNTPELDKLKEEIKKYDDQISVLSQNWSPEVDLELNKVELKKGDIYNKIAQITSEKWKEINPTTNFKNWFQFAENYTNPRIDELRKETLELNTQLETIDSKDFMNGVDDILKRKNQILNEINDELQREWKKINPQRQTIYPLMVKDATTFNPKQQGALDQLNQLIKKEKVSNKEIEQKLQNLDSYKKFLTGYESTSRDGIFNDYDPANVIKELMVSYDGNNDFFKPYYNNINFPSLLEDINKNPDLVDYFSYPLTNVKSSTYVKNIVNKIPTVYDAHGFGYEDIPYGLSGQLKKAPEGTEVFRFNNLVDPDPASTHYAILKPNAVRSKFAAFDPARKDESNLLASIAAGGLSIPLLLRMLEEDQYGY